MNVVLFILSLTFFISIDSNQTSLVYDSINDTDTTIITVSNLLDKNIEEPQNLDYHNLLTDCNILQFISILVAILIAIFPWVRNKFFRRPEIVIELEYHKGLSTNEGLSNKNDFSEKIIKNGNEILIFGLKWKYIIRIRNNSDILATYPKLHKPKVGIWFNSIEELNIYKPIRSSDNDLIIKCEYEKYTETKPSDRPKFVKFPVEFNDLKILLEYQNSAKIKFYTLFEFENLKSKNTFYFKKPKGF